MSRDPEPEGTTGRDPPVRAGRVVAVSLGDRPGLAKRPVDAARLVAGHGMEGDRHADSGPRQLSLLDAAVAEELRATGIPAEPGLLGENLLVAGIPLDRLEPGSQLRIGDAVVEVTGPRPVCKGIRAADPRALKAIVGRAGLMARVTASGTVRPGAPVLLVGPAQATEPAQTEPP